MEMNVRYYGSSDHFSEPNAINATFGAEDGTSMTVKMGKTAREELVLGAQYKVTITQVEAQAPTQGGTAI